ncbi:MAG: type I-F CRISPR-associated helicase Cas3f [Chlamydiota bacterium]
MNILLISQCSKKALKESCRILDQFAERCGERTWQTAITQAGLKTLRRLLKQTARKNTAVACHWIRGHNNSELAWIVGDASQFNEHGSVPTNTTKRDVLRASSENNWHMAEDISLLAGIAGLFHDFGKANNLFQKKLEPESGGLSYEPYRHEWISLRIFQAFVGKLSDQEWLRKLSGVDGSEEKSLVDSLIKDGYSEVGNPFKELPPLARTIGWLIFSHHRLPKFPGKKGCEGAPRLKAIDRWLLGSEMGPSWNSPQCNKEKWVKSKKNAVWKFKKGTPLRSETWRLKARKLAKRALKYPDFIKDWMDDRFSMHMARMILMLSDHCYSSNDATVNWQDKNYKAYANTDRHTKQLKQKLDEHLIGVSHDSISLGKGLPVLRQTLPSITRYKAFKKRCIDQRFRWQNKCYELASGLRERSVEQGFFGINMASTGRGKTFANARIMYGLADEKLGCRFSVALGLRTLTLQTGDALRERLKIEEEDLAILIGSSAVSSLHDFNNKYEKILGAESAEDILDECQYIRYEGSLDEGRLNRWLRSSPGLHKLLSAPITVSTIDHLMPATEGERGGKQIAPMLRLLTSDLVLDEPDDFDLNDMPAVTRLVNWAGMLGSRVLVSSATLPPAFIRALFDAYRAGRAAFQHTSGEPGRPVNVCCAWFDENRVQKSDHGDLAGFEEKHYQFVEKRVADLKKVDPIRQAEIAPVQVEEKTPEAAVLAIADSAYEFIHRLHGEHCQTQHTTGKKVSFGLVRMANINPLVAVAKQLFSMTSKSNHRIHYCVYHSQYPLAVRSVMEQRLDSMLNRSDPQAIWEKPDVKKALEENPKEDNHIFVVLATAVAEVGRDHDYDWAVVEPSSMRSFIQLAGRIQRHRNQCPETPNILLLSQNYRALTGKGIAFEKPGFECEQLPLSSKDLHDLLEEEQYKSITSIPRIMERSSLDYKKNLADLEHEHLKARLFGNEKVKEYAELWWSSTAHWSFELQRRMPFRQRTPDEEYVLYTEDKDEPAQFYKVEEDSDSGLKLCEENFDRVDLDIGQRVSFLDRSDIDSVISDIADSMDWEISGVSKKFGVVTLRKDERQWSYHRNVGIHHTLDR